MDGLEVHNQLVVTAVDDLLKHGMELSFAGDRFFPSTDFGRCLHVMFSRTFLICLKGM